MDVELRVQFIKHDNSTKQESVHHILTYVPEKKTQSIRNAVKKGTIILNLVSSLDHFMLTLFRRN